MLLLLFIVLIQGHFFIAYREREKHRLVASHTHPDQGSSRNLAMCLDQELNPQPFGVLDETPTNRTTSGCFSLRKLVFLSIPPTSLLNRISVRLKYSEYIQYSYNTWNFSLLKGDY